MQTHHNLLIGSQCTSSITAACAVC